MVVRVTKKNIRERERLNLKKISEIDLTDLEFLADMKKIQEEGEALIGSADMHTPEDLAFRFGGKPVKPFQFTL